MAEKNKPELVILDVPLNLLYRIESEGPKGYIGKRQKRSIILRGITIRGQIIDEKKKPFANRPVSVLLPNGDEIEVTTDSQGFFEVTAPPRARFAAVLMVLKSKSTSPKAKKH
jgi:phosphatidate phosphatase APP1